MDEKHKKFPARSELFALERKMEKLRNPKKSKAAHLHVKYADAKHH
jgi:hypothetical protein